MKREKMIEMITKTVKHTHNEKDLKDLNEMSKVELKEILNDIYFGGDFMTSKNKGLIKEYIMTTVTCNFFYGEEENEDCY